MRSVRIVIAILAVLCTLHTPLFSQGADLKEANDTDSQLTTVSLASALVPISCSSLEVVPLVFPETSSAIPRISNPLLLGSHIPRPVSRFPGGRDSEIRLFVQSRVAGAPPSETTDFLSPLIVLCW
jgi:hypothetical protein